MTVITEKTPVSQLRPRYAAIDVGSNNVRMNLYGVDDTGVLRKIKIPEKTTHQCKLGEGVMPENPVLKRENVAMATDTLSGFNRILQNYEIASRNVCTVMTAAVRKVEGTPQGERDIARFASALGNRAVVVLSDEEEALLDGLAAKLACPENHRIHRGAHCSAAFAAIGGGSVQLGVIEKCGRIQDAISLPYGIYPLIEQSGGDIQQAGKIFNQILHKHYPDHTHKTLLVLGGCWRALGEAACKRNAHTLHGREKIQQTLTSITHRKQEYFEGHSKRVRENAANLPLAAAMLRRIAKYFESERVVFLETSIRDAIADQMHALDSGAVTRPSRGLERLFYHATPLQALHA